MGCDIHMFVQYRNIERAKKNKKEGRNDYWWGFGGHLNPGRNYTLFGILAGVRDNPMDKDKMFYPKGLPGFELSYEALDSLYLYIREEDECDEEGSCTLAQAQRWGKYIINDSSGKPWRTLHPDWHSHTWLTTQELVQTYRWYKKETGHAPGLEYRVLLKMMKDLENKGENEVVVVFWFDN